MIESREVEEANSHKRERESEKSGDDVELTSSSKKQSQIITNAPVIKSQPNFVFASWLCFMMSQDKLRQGSGVIDIAGGNGLLSFELTCRYGVPSTVLDPRQMKFNSILRRRMKKLTKNRLKEYQRISKPAIEDQEVASEGVKWDNCVIKVMDDYHVLDQVKEAVSSETDVLPFQQYQVYYEGPQSAITSSREEDSAFLAGASMFVGMHPGEKKLCWLYVGCVLLCCTAHDVLIIIQ
jgi:hypothetical protein